MQFHLINMKNNEYILVKALQPIPLAVWSKVYVWGRLIAGIAGSNPTDGRDVCLVYLLCVV